MTRIALVSRDIFSHLHSHVVTRTISRITVTLSRKEYSRANELKITRDTNQDTHKTKSTSWYTQVRTE